MTTAPEVQQEGRASLKALMLFLLTSIYYYLFVRVLWRVGDEGTLVYGAQRVVEGDLPYRDFFEVMGPASFYWLGLFFKVFGVHVAVSRGLLLFTGAASVLLIYWMTCRVYRGPFELLPAFYYMIVAIPLWPATNHHWDSNLFALLALGAFFLWQDKGVMFYLVLAGVLAGIVSCFIQHKGLLVFIGLLLALTVNNWRVGMGVRRLIAHSALVAAGYGAVGGLVILLFFWAGGLIWPLTNYHNVNVLPYGYGLMELVYRLDWKPMLQALLPPWAVTPLCMALMGPFFTILALPVLLVVLTAAAYLRQSDPPQLFSLRLWPYWTVGLGLWVSELHRQDIVHLIYGSPVLLILLLVVWDIVWRRWELVRNLGLGLVTLTLIMYGAGNCYKLLAVQHRLETRRGTLYAFEPDDALTFLHKHVKEKEEVLIYPYYPIYYFLADVKNPTRHSILMYHINTKKQFNEVIENLKRKKVKYVFWDTFVEGDNLKKWFPKYKKPSIKELKLEQFLKDHYQLIGIRNGFRILRRRDLKETSLQ